MRKANIAAVTLALAVGYLVAGTTRAVADDRNGPVVRVLDDCLPGDPGWNPTGGCTLNPTQGDVPFAEFGALLAAPTTAGGVALVGHPSWRMEPSHITVKQGKEVFAVNDGGRGHTFTKVDNFGGGFIDGLNFGLVPAAKCLPPPATLPPGGRDTIDTGNLSPGLHRFQCCIHPWMRATVRVEPRH